MFYRTDDPVRDFLAHDARQQRRLNRLPKCVECGEPIQSEHCYEVNDELLCPECLKENHLKKTEDFEI